MGEAEGPGLVLEVASHSTRRDAVDPKRRLYARLLAVRQYWKYDRTGTSAVAVTGNADGRRGLRTATGEVVRDGTLTLLSEILLGL